MLALERGGERVLGTGNPSAAGGRRPPAPSTPEAVNWGRSGPNEIITLNVLRTLKAAGS